MVSRPGAPWPDHVLADRLERVPIPLLEISSTDLRARVAEGRSIRYLVPDAVRDHIREHDLYRPADA